MRIEGDGRDRITEAGGVIAGWTRLWSTLLVLHVAGPDGRCRGCLSAVRAAPRWPCRLAELAEAARTAHRANSRSASRSPADDRSEVGQSAPPRASMPISDAEIVARTGFSPREGR
jgi:hypothetical protein